MFILGFIVGAVASIFAVALMKKKTIPSTKNINSFDDE